LPVEIIFGTETEYKTEKDEKGEDKEVPTEKPASSTIQNLHGHKNLPISKMKITKASTVNCIP
jgi:hypothetical protein